MPVGGKLRRKIRKNLMVGGILMLTMEERHPDILKKCEYLDADRGCDDGKLITRLLDNYEIKPIIDIRNMWKDGEEIKVIEGKNREMSYGGFEKDRETLKYRCPAKHYGYECIGCSKCPVKKAVRIPLIEDRRVLTPLARSSCQWKSIYKKRTSVERVNSRPDVSFGFEEHFIRGLSKMKLRCSLALCVMLAMALGRIKENQAGLTALVYKAIIAL